MVLDQVLAVQKRGDARGIFSVCSAHPYVLKQTLGVCRLLGVPALIEATCNQVNQFGGYTGMQPRDFVAYVRGIARETGFPFEDILLGGDHLGPSVWQGEPAEIAMEKAQTLIHAYVTAGFAKVHLDCSMRLSDDPPGALDVEVSARRAARLALVAEQAGGKSVRYVIGSEVPVPGGATGHEEGVHVTRVEDARQTIAVTQAAFAQAGLQSAWERVLALVVQPGVEFGDDFVLPYQPQAAVELSRFIEGYPLVFEAHSTDYQTRDALKALVRDHFAILKVGPGLTFAFREAAFALARIEEELFPPDRRSHLIQVLDEAMLRAPGHWQNYYRGDPAEQAFKRKYSLSDRLRYYWTDPAVDQAFEKMLQALEGKVLPVALLRQYLPDLYDGFQAREERFSPAGVLLARVGRALADYAWACYPDLG